MDKIVPVIFSTNDNYAYYCYATIFSLKEVRDEEKEYRIHVLKTDLSTEKCEMLESLSENRFSVTVVDLNEIVKYADLRGMNFFSAETFYRLFIPDIFEYEKIIYLDSDMILIKDVSPLLHIDTHGCAIAAAEDVRSPVIERHNTELGIKKGVPTFNAGVMLIDCAEFKKRKIKEQCLELLYKDYDNTPRIMRYMDQDALNAVIQGQFTAIDARWNFQWQYMWRLYALENSYTNTYIELSKNPWIIHYAGDRKPWTHVQLPMSEVFWKYARKTVAFTEMVKHTLRSYELKCDLYEDRISDEKAKTVHYQSEMKSNYKRFEEAEKKRAEAEGTLKYRFPVRKVPYESRIAIYGAGLIGKSFYRQLKAFEYATVTLWTDSNFGKFANILPIAPPSELFKKSDCYDYILIAIKDRTVADEIRKELTERGIDDGKIIWDRYIN